MSKKGPMMSMPKMPAMPKGMKPMAMSPKMHVQHEKPSGGPAKKGK